MAEQTITSYSTDRRTRRFDNKRTPHKEADKQFEEIVIEIDRVTRVFKGGRRLRFRALVVVGDKKNKVGVGVAKGADVQLAVAKAINVAKKQMITIPIENNTIPHDIEVAWGGARILLKPAAPGTGIIAGGAVRTIIGVTGIQNLLTKSLGSSNKINIAYATIDALNKVAPRKDWLNNRQKKPTATATKELKND